MGDLESIPQLEPGCWYLVYRGDRWVIEAHTRDSARTYGKSDPIDALAVARAVLREPDLPIARLDGVEREIRLLVDDREDLVAERTRAISRLRWHLHELDPSWQPPAKLERASAFDRTDDHLAKMSPANPVIHRLATRLMQRLRVLTIEINELTEEITERVTQAPSEAAAVGHRATVGARSALTLTSAENHLTASG